MSRYTLGHDESVLRSHSWRTAENSASYLLPHLWPGARVLDVGCGPGTITTGLAAAVGPEGSVLGVDNAPEVVELARTVTSGDDRADVQFAVADVMALDLPDGSFDVVHAHQVLQHLEDPVGALREMQRVVRPGGLIAARDADYAAMTWHPADPDLDDWLSTYRRTARLNGAEPDAGRQLLSWAIEAGFAEVIPSASVWCFATPGERGWWGGLQADRIASSAIAEQAREAALADEAALRRMAAAWRRWAEQETAWFAVLHGEILCRVAGADDE